ncbi:type IV toxin-antitoxin system AbiEi family antitoxin [Clavibacter zhangzhiyongii]|uniref:type IV toxin-antitoxin system AbiEi family antitoxin n=1 Tax=Clavibacter zhangzhiyongii TaxID=2768071 RepID=UPI0039DF8510
MSPRLAPVLSVLDLPLAELCSARLDGEVYEVDACYSPVDELASPWLRAAALAAQVPSRLIAERSTAAWVHGAVRTPPRTHEYCVDSVARCHPPALRNVRIREVVLDERDTLVLAGLRVTTPLRTLCDIARTVADLTPRHRAACLGLLAMPGVTEAAAREHLAGCGALPDKRRALARLDELARLAATADPGRDPSSSGAVSPR